jgi:DNA polymerase-3 subunit delta
LRVRPEQLEQHLAKGLAPIYLVSGDEPLQSNEACDAIRAAARSAGHDNREIMEAGAGFDWNALAAEANSLSLFAEKKIIDLRIPGGKPGREGGKALTEYCERPPEDTILLITLPKLDRSQQNSKWFKTIEQLGVIVQIWPIEVQRLPQWIEQRLRKAGLHPDREAVQMLADRVEGNLLAAHQEIEKLLLLHGTGSINAEQLANAVADSARYDVFELVDSALRGETERCLRILGGLRGEGVAPPVVLWALHREIAQITAISADAAKGLSLDHAMTRAKVWEKRKPLVRNATARLKTPAWLALLGQCQQADAAAKGADPRDPWLLLEQISAQMSTG